MPKIRKHKPSSMGFHTIDYICYKSHIDIVTQCWNWLGQKDKDGYGQYRTHAKDKWTKAYRESYKLFKGDIPAGHGVLHTCDNPQCVNPEHLYAGTPMQNMRDMIRKGRNRIHDREVRIRSARTSCRYGPADRENIKREYQRGGCTHESLAAKYGVNRGTINKILNGSYV